jgi:hypothetical protein
MSALSDSYARELFATHSRRAPDAIAWRWRWLRDPYRPSCTIGGGPARNGVRSTGGSAFRSA